MCTTMHNSCKFGNEAAKMQILSSADGKKPFEDRTRLGWAPQPFLKVFVLLSLPVMLAGCTSTNAIDVAAKEAALETTDLLKSGPIEPLAAPAALQRLMDASLVKQDALFEGRAALIEASILRRAHGWSRFPDIVPTISVDDVGQTQGQLSADLTLIDWGKSGGEKQTLDARLLRARMDLWQEHNVFLVDILNRMAEMSAAQSRADLIDEHLAINKGFQKLVEERVSAGVGEAAEIPLVALRVQELLRALAIEKNQSAVQVATLVQLSGLSSAQVPKIELSKLLKVMDFAPQSLNPPSLQLARSDVLVADGVIRTALADRLPAIVLSGVAALTGSASSGVNLGLGNKSLTESVAQTDLKLARTSAVVALARLQAQEEALVQNSKLFLLRDRELNTRIAALSKQITVSKQAIKTFDTQFTVGARPITDAVQVYERLYEGQRLLIEAKKERADLLIERLGELGALSPQPKISLGNAS